jgi:hypothetical protein
MDFAQVTGLRQVRPHGYDGITAGTPRAQREVPDPD